MIPLLDEAIETYAREHTTPVTPLLEELREVTHAETTAPQMQVGPVEGRLLKLLVQISGARRVLEIGTFTGYSALMMAEGLPPDGRIVTCDIDPDATAIARRFFDRSGYGDRIEIRLGPALETVARLDGSFDLCFLDADKEHYPDYFDAVVPRLRPGGLLVADNVLWSGQVTDPADRRASTAGLRAFNERMVSDARMEAVMLTVRDGVTLARRR